MTQVCGHVGYVSPTWLIVKSHGFRAYDPIRAHDLVYGFWLAARYGAAELWVSADGFDTRTHQVLQSSLRWVILAAGNRYVANDHFLNLLVTAIAKSSDSYLAVSITRLV